MTTYRVPPSLSWLVKVRRRLAGRIAIADREYAEAVNSRAMLTPFSL